MSRPIGDDTADGVADPRPHRVAPRHGRGAVLQRGEGGRVRRGGDVLQRRHGTGKKVASFIFAIIFYTIFI